MAPEVAIVMPYFQREPGILRKTLRHVFAQCNAPSFKLIIVDDGSPIPAESELVELAETQRSQITIIRRPNGGIAAACNTGLDAVPATVCWVARLDSDDHWAPDHLAEATAMMRVGFDFFFANELGGEGVPRLEYLGFRPEEYFPRPEGPGLFEMRHGDFLRMMVRHAQVCTSTIMFRRSKFASLRYRITYGLSEDMHLFLDIAQQSPRVAFSARVHVNHGPGLHVNRIHDWKTNRALLTACDFASYHARILREVQLTAAETGVVKGRLSNARSDVAMILLAMLAAGRWPDRRVLTQFLPRHPRLLPDVCHVAARRLAPGRPE
jgi:succinoglycan biosynthesis protein ExoW